MRNRDILLTAALSVFLGACATERGPLAPVAYPGQPTAQAPAPAAPASPSEPQGAAPTSALPSPTIVGDAIAAAALAERGRPYRLGGESPTGFDCSGLVQYVFAQQGIAVPRQVIDQFAAGEPVRRPDIQAGDLLFFATTSDEASHVGIALDEDRFVDAPSTNGHVRIDRLSAPYWNKRFIGARRVTPRG
ncbi:MAG TPA: C40 family peptidase [Vicinamibacterales bacterium]|jgi:cell wall-associated NlpC family hydrolase